MLDTPPPARGVFERFLDSTSPPDELDRLLTAIRKAVPWRCINCNHRQTIYGPCFMCGECDFERLIDDE